MKHSCLRSIATLFLIILLINGVVTPSSATATPAVTGVSGTIKNGTKVTISGSGFGSKSPAKPYLWAPFEGSANPSNLGIVTSWNNLDNMAYTSIEGAGGTGGLKATNNSGIWTANVNASGFAWNDYNQQMYLFRKTKRNFEVTSDLNWKVWRLWGPGLTYPDIYISTGNGNVPVEGIDHPAGAGWIDPPSLGRGPTNEYKTEEIIIKSNSASNQFDALLWFYVNGALAIKMPYQTYNYRTLKLKNDARAMTDNFVVHGVKANTTFPSHYRYWADDIYLDTTWARVMIGNATTWAGSTHKEIQIPSAWNNGSIEVTINTGTFTSGQQTYLYVVEANGNVNTNGYPVKIGSVGTSPTPQPPQSLRVLDY
jgi:hypothetical protein